MATKEKEKKFASDAPADDSKASKKSSKKKASSKENRPPAGEQTPVSTLASTSLKPKKGEAGTIAGGAPSHEDLIARVKGRTSDAASRKEGKTPDETPSDLAAGSKATDAGEEEYPFPVQGDVEIKTVPSAKNAEGEVDPPLPVGAWVRLGKHTGVPENLEGRVATVTVSPTYLCNCDWSPRTHEHQSPDQGIEVKLRDETGATITLPKEAFVAVGLNGRHEVLPHG